MSQLYTVFGATGAQGAPVVEQLLAAGHRVRAVARNAERVQSRFGRKVEAVAADLADSHQVQEALEGAAGAFAHLPIPQADSGPDMPQRQLEALLKAARAGGLPQLVFSTSGPGHARFRSSPIIDGNAAATRAVLGSGVPAVVLQPTFYGRQHHVLDRRARPPSGGARRRISFGQSLDARSEVARGAEKHSHLEDASRMELAVVASPV